MMSRIVLNDNLRNNGMFEIDNIRHMFYTKFDFGTVSSSLQLEPLVGFHYS